MNRLHLVAAFLLVLALACLPLGRSTAGEAQPEAPIVARPGLFEPLTEPPCSYCSTQHRKGLVRDDDPVVAWLRANHNGGAAPLRHFLAGPRVVNDTYGLFFYDPDGGYVSVFGKDYGYRFYGWRRGVMVAEGPDGTLWSALSGRAIQGPQQGRRLVREPSLVTEWAYWLMLHPESTAYDLYDGERYLVVELPTELSAEAEATMGDVDGRLEPTALVLGVESEQTARAYPLDVRRARACVVDELDGQPIVVFWYGPTQTAVAFNRRLDDRVLTFAVDSIGPESAPFIDRETGTRWTVAGRAVDGPLRGAELDWVPSLRCRWYAWSAEYPDTELHGHAN